MAQFRVGIDSYCLNPLRMGPFGLLEWVQEVGGEGVQFSEVHLPEGRELDEGFLRELAVEARVRGMYLEWGGGQHVPFETTTWEPKDLLPGNRKAAEEAGMLGATVVRSCSGGFFRWENDAPPTETLILAMAGALKPQAPLFRDLGVTLALELHFEFTTHELVRLFEMCGAEPGGWLGICLDTFNMIPLLEDPLLGTGRALPWVVAAHMKDGALELDDEGLFSFPTEVGEGRVDFRGILDQLHTLDRPINLSVEDHGGSFRTPFFDDDFRSRFPDLDVRELSGLVASAREGGEAHRRGDLTVTERADWPDLCEGRTRRGVASLQEIVREWEGETQ